MSRGMAQNHTVFVEGEAYRKVVSFFIEEEKGTGAVIIGWTGLMTDWHTVRAHRQRSPM